MVGWESPCSSQIHPLNGEIYIVELDFSWFLHFLSMKHETIPLFSSPSHKSKPQIQKPVFCKDIHPGRSHTKYEQIMWVKQL